MVCVSEGLLLVILKMINWMDLRTDAGGTYFKTLENN